MNRPFLFLAPLALMSLAGAIFGSYLTVAGEPTIGAQIALLFVVAGAWVGWRDSRE